MNIAEEITKLKAEQAECQATEKKAHDRAIEIGRQIGKLETQKKKIDKILGEGQKGVAE